jgi:pimeloyl-ACP methyl ester carboxylesterase
MPLAAVNGLDLFYDVSGPDDGVPMLLVMGLGSQYQEWDDGFVAGLTDRGFRVVRYDNRDVGESTRIDVGDLDVGAQLLAAFSGGEASAPYLLSDMADDGVALLDHLDIPAAHVVGVSMGGMIAQTIAIEHRDRVLTLTSIMSTTGDSDVGAPTPEAMTALMSAPAADRDTAIEQRIKTGRIIGSPEHFDEAKARQRAERAYDRGYYPQGAAQQLLAVLASGSRAEQLRQLDVPTLVVHGEIDPLVTVTGGRRTAELVPGAELLLIDDMGHDLPQPHWPQIIEAITSLASRVSA